MNRHLNLMRLHDEELDPEEREALLAELDAEDRDVLEALSVLGDSLRAHGEQSGPAADGIADAVMKRLDGKPQLELVAGTGPVPARPPAKPRRGATPVLVAGLALAAAAAFVLWQRTAPGPAQVPPRATAMLKAPELPRTPTAPEATVTEPSTPAETSPAVAIEAVDFGNQAGSIFVVGEQSTPVVWLVEEPPGTKMEKL